MPEIIDFNYLREKMGTAIEALACGDGTLIDRLDEAFHECHVIRPDEVPIKFKDDWIWIRERLWGHEKAGVRRTVERYSPGERMEIATKLFNIGWEICTNQAYSVSIVRK